MKYAKPILLTACMGLLGGALVAPSSYAGGVEQDRPTVMKLKYTGDTCAAWFNHQPEAHCQDYGFPSTEEVRIVAYEPAGEHLWFDGIVKQGKEFYVDALNGELVSFTSDTMAFAVYDPQDVLLQTLEIDIGTPKETLVKNDVYGSLTLRKVDYKFKVPKNYDNIGQYIVSFEETVSWDEIEDYSKYWDKYYGVITGMALPFINALALKVPNYVTADMLGADVRVAAVEYNQLLGSPELLNAQGQSFIHPVGRKLSEQENSWSILKLFGLPYEATATDSVSGRLDKETVPEIVRIALKALGDNKLRIAVFDTGLESAHKEAAHKVKGGVGVVNTVVDRSGKNSFETGVPLDDNGHGTHVTGTIAAMLDEKHKRGHDAKVEFYSVKVLDEYAMGALSNVILGLQWAIYNDVDLINMSLGYYRESAATRKALEAATQAGIMIVASVGNRSNYNDKAVLGGGSAEGGAAEGGAAEGGAAEGGAAEGGAAEGGAAEGGAAEGGAAEGGAAEGGAAEGGAAEGGAAEGGAAEGGAAEGGAAEGGAAEGGAVKLDQGTPLPLYAVMYPARYPEVIAVGASTPTGALAAFSNRGEEMDVAAPGVNILSADVTNGDPEEGYGTTSGTSMAAPHVTAAVALMLALDPYLDVQTVQDILHQTAIYTDGSGVGDLDLIGALEEVMMRLGVPNPAALSRKELEKEYRKQLKKKIHQVSF